MENLNKKYTQIQLIYKNNYIEAYTAINLNTNEEVTLKILNEDIDMEYFKDIINKITNLQNPNLININHWDSFEENNRMYYYVEEGYFPSRNLTKSVYLNEFSAIKYVKILKQVSQGLKEFHFNDLFWGNLSCDYIYVNNNGQAKLDTMSYFLKPISQENELDESDDIYSLGVILYQLLTQESDFSLQKCKTKIPDKYLLFIINRCTNKKYEVYEDLNELIKDLDKYIEYGYISEKDNNKALKVDCLDDKVSNGENYRKTSLTKLIRNIGICTVVFVLIIVGINKDKLFNLNNKTMETTKLATTTVKNNKIEKRAKKETKKEEKKYTKKKSKKATITKSKYKKKIKKEKTGKDKEYNNKTTKNDEEGNYKHEENAEDKKANKQYNDNNEELSYENE